MALNPDDLLLVNRSGTNFKIEYGLLKQNIINGIGGAIVSEDEPDGRHEGDLWYQPSTDSLFVWVVSDTTGVVTSVSVRNGGSGYTTNETNVETIGGDGEGLTLDIQAGVGGNYASPTVNQGGSGYAVSNVVFLTGAGNQNGSATVTAVNTVATGAWEAVGAGEGGGSSVSVGDNAPADPAQGDLWFNTDDGRLYVWYEDANTSQWVDASPAGGGGGEGGDTTINYNGASAWGDVAADGTLNGGLNCTVQRDGPGSYTVTFDNPMPNDSYSLTFGSYSFNVTVDSKTADGFSYLTYQETPLNGQQDFRTSFAVHSSNALPPRGGTGADAWVNFWGNRLESDPTQNPIVGQNVQIASSFNVDRVVYSGTGTYTIFYANDLGTANYAVSGSAVSSRNTARVPRIVAPKRRDDVTSNSVGIYTIDDTGTFEDCAMVSVVVHASNAQLPDTVTQEQLDAVLNNWTRSGTTLKPTNAGDSIDVAGDITTQSTLRGGAAVLNNGNIQLNSDGSGSFTLGVNFFSNSANLAVLDNYINPNYAGLTSNNKGLCLGGSGSAVALAGVTTTTSTGTPLHIFPENGVQRIYASTSLRAAKTNIQSLPTVWNKIKALNPCSFNGVQDHDRDVNSYGFIAEEVNEVDAHFGVSDEEGLKTVNYNAITAVLVAALKEVITRNEQLEALSVNLANRLGAVESNEIIDDATDTALLQLLANASSRLDSIEARLTALEGN